MVAIQPFRVKKDDVETGPWRAIIPGKGLVELASETATREEASKRIEELMPRSPLVEKKARNAINEALGGTANSKAEASTYSTSSTDSTSPTDKTDKPKPGEINRAGLSGLSPEKLKQFRARIADALANGNVSIDRALVSIFRDDVPVLTPESYLLLSTGWELACEQYFVNGIPPAWIIILLANALTVTKLVETSKPKPPKDDESTEPKPTEVPVNEQRRPNNKK